MAATKGANVFSKAVGLHILGRYTLTLSHTTRACSGFTEPSPRFQALGSFEGRLFSTYRRKVVQFCKTRAMKVSSLVRFPPPPPSSCPRPVVTSRARRSRASTDARGILTLSF